MRFAVICLLSCVCSVYATKATPKELDPLFKALEQVESGGKQNPKDGDNGRAIGNFQIWESYWKDATEFDKTIGGTYQDCRNKAYAKRIMVAYWKRYCPTALADANYEVLSRVHNGGWNGANPKAKKIYKNTTLYYAKVIRALDEQKGE